jgi:hypothetical protein
MLIFTDRLQVHLSIPQLTQDEVDHVELHNLKSYASSLCIPKMIEYIMP